MSLDNLKKVLGKEKLVFGSRQTIRNLKNSKTKIIFLASNCSNDAKESIKYYAGLAKADITELKQTRHELSVFCKKNYPLGVISY
tara:strand:- start:2364 stop:2618 length:255 start_codon:yes stop_codon:yes gene_type:complete